MHTCHVCSGKYPSPALVALTLPRVMLLEKHKHSCIAMRTLARRRSSLLRPSRYRNSCTELQRDRPAVRDARAAVTRETGTRVADQERLWRCCELRVQDSGEPGA